MRKIFYLTTITLLFLSSCQKETVTSSRNQTVAEQQAVLDPARSEQAATPFNITFDENLDGFQLFNSCTNEQMTIHGSNHVVFHGFYDGPDSKTTFHYDLATVSAVGESGAKYIVNGTLNAQEGVYTVGEYTFKFVNRFRFIRPGGDNNFFFETTHYLKVDADGNWTVIKAEVDRSYCQ